ncbi:MAG TPA: carboxypeptidase-like regulatory domain-containing protein, partial [Bryobacteraceae bacterium]|nr:carboxypeptidase-like regulatory domain-containing protein [Bryobacteraceae bacterium]
MKVGAVLSMAAVAGFVIAGSAFGQAVSQISGTTKDQSGAAVPGVEVTATQTDTGIQRTVVTNDAGEFVLPNLQIGPYRLEAKKAGFQNYVQTG